MAHDFVAPRWRLPLPLVLLGLWLIVVLAAPLLGVLQPTALTVLVVVFGPPAALLVLLAASPRVLAYVRALDLRALTLAQTVRVVGLVFLPLMANGTLPPSFALPAGLGDALIGLTAPLVATRIVPRLPAGRGVFLTWTALGILDLLLAVSAGLLSVGGAAPLGKLPLSLFPTFVVPLALIMHLESIIIVSGSAPRRIPASA
jgi:hypothetical protein